MRIVSLQWLINKVSAIISYLGSYFIAWILIITTGGAWFSDATVWLDLNWFKWLALCVSILVSILLICCTATQKLELPSFVKKKFIIAILCIVTYMFQFQGDFEGYFGHFFLQIIWYGVLLICIKKTELIWEAFINLMVIIAIVSLFFYIMGSCLKILPETSVTALYWGVWDTSSIRKFYNVYYEAQFLKIAGGALVIPRNCGIFSEAPMYNFVLCVALAVELFVAKKVYRWKIIVLILTIISTLTTTGYLFLILTILCYFANIVFEKRGMSIHKVMYVILALLGAVIALLLVLNKMTSPSGAGSFEVRSDHLFACFRAWLDSPILGVGFENETAVMDFVQYKQGMSIGLPFLLATGGVVLTSVIVVPYVINMMISISIRNYDEICFETLFIMLYFFTAITKYPILVFYIAYSVMVNCEPKEKKRRIDNTRQAITLQLEKICYNTKDFAIYIKKYSKYILLVSAVLSIGMTILFAINKTVNFYVVVSFGLLCFMGMLLSLIFVNYGIYIMKNKKLK